MFFGGTNFGFMNSLDTITSYDYDAPLTEAGDYGDKFFKTKEIIGMCIIILLLYYYYILSKNLDK